MKKILILLLFLGISLSGFAQKYVFFKTSDKLIVTKPNGNRVAVSPISAIELQGTAGISILQITNPDLITLTNVDFVASNIPVQTTLQGLFDYLSQITFVATAPPAGVLTISATDSIKYRKQVYLGNPYVVKASDSTKLRYTIRVANPQVNQTISTAGFQKITDGSYTTSVKAASTASVAADIALVVDQRPSTALFGTNTPTVTAITTAGNIISTTNCVKILIENQSLTNNATITYGGQAIVLGYKGNSDGYKNFYSFESIYDVASKKWSPFATMVIDAANSNVYLTKIFAQ